MDRLACVDLPALPLQILLRRYPDWENQPAAVVERDKPQAPILWVEERARERGILPGMRYAAALSLCADLRAGVVEEHEVEETVTRILDRLSHFSPSVEPSSGEPGIFWLDASGLHHLYPSLAAWASEIRTELESDSFESSIAVGFSRFGTYALARSGNQELVVEDPGDETRRARQIPLARLNIDPGFREALHKLGVDRVEELLALPPAGIRERFGDEAHRLHRLAAGDLWTPLRPAERAEPVTSTLLLTEPVLDTTQLLFHVKGLLHTLLRDLAQRNESLTSLQICFVAERGDDHIDTIRPAAPTTGSEELVLLTRIRLESLQLTAGVIEIHLDVSSGPTDQLQADLLGQSSGRDLDAGARALGFVRAEFGPDSVVKPVLRDGHLPEASFGWEPLVRPSLPRAVRRSPPPLVQRLWHRPRSVRQPPPRDPRGWMLHGLGLSTIVRWDGPHVFQGGWWTRELHREYWFATTREGEVLWLYHDRKRGKWVVQGRVE